MATSARLLTAEEFLHLPDSIEGGKMELVCGRVVTMSPVGRLHSKCVGRIERSLHAFVEERALGETHVELGFVLRCSPDAVRAPDVAFIDAASLSRAGDWEGFFEGPSTLAVEVRSPDDRGARVEEKVTEYLTAGTLRAWDVDPRKKTVTVFHPGGDVHVYSLQDTLSSGDAGFTADGFALPLHDVFA